MNRASDDLVELTSTIQNANQKLHLRDALFHALTSTIGHDAKDADTALREFYVQGVVPCETRLNSSLH
jgi:hypothetical protein